jgi:hypothetical protein
MIVCLGWGSLVWKPDQLPVEGGWREDGPALPVEFARVSSGNRLTLVLVKGALALPVLWARLKVESLEQAIEVLADRENTPAKNVGFWSAAKASNNDEVAVIADWARSRGVAVAVWTALQPGYRNKRGKALTSMQALDHLRGLKNAERHDAEDYVRRAPVQIATPYRALFEKELGWTPIGDSESDRR